MNVTKAFMFSALFGLAACMNHAQPELQPKTQKMPDDLADLAKNASVEVVYSSADEDDVPKVEISSPDPKSARGKALAAIDSGADFVLYSLQPWSPPQFPRSDAEYGTPEFEAHEAAEHAAWEKSRKEWCAHDDCLYDNLILGKTKLDRAADIETATNNAKLSLGQVPDYATACIAEFRHAIEFVANGHKFQILLCYQCGQVGVAIDGEIGYAEQTYDMGKEGDLDAVLTKAGIPLAPKPAE